MYDFRGHLSAAAQKRITDAHVRAELIRTHALSRAQILQRSDPNYRGFFSDRSGGPAGIELAEADLQAALIVTKTVTNEAIKAGKSGFELRGVIDVEIESVTNSYELTGVQRRVLRLECDRLTEDAVLPTIEPEHNESASQIPFREPKLPGSPESTPARKTPAAQLKSSGKAIRRSPRYGAIDLRLCEIAKMWPRDQEEILNKLVSGGVRVPRAEPFKSAGGWITGFNKDKPAARAWLSKNWARLQLTPLERGPKKK